MKRCIQQELTDCLLCAQWYTRLKVMCDTWIASSLCPYTYSEEPKRNECHSVKCYLGDIPVEARAAIWRKDEMVGGRHPHHAGKVAFKSSTEGWEGLGPLGSKKGLEVTSRTMDSSSMCGNPFSFCSFHCHAAAAEGRQYSQPCRWKEVESPVTDLRELWGTGEANNRSFQ